ncbi:folylpolyglutamate synthase/dihydrofolate synthase family protein [Leptotrichia sp. oral taxon 879]|uniref:bifunctional folylpolyglutamate synthase/dihydrofolate synthase n=1 Tax=Leptotrichia sp. oral taxon 879 TaxID=1227267 RepID=UPI0003AE73C0|nr:Mur ligase family protein [Leptotrichia sp. oral taxon 879]ERK51111.1 protein FolC [Leptotrichia sp. oral taxon 879 str. F0557]
MKIDEILEKIFNMRTINKRITNESLNQNNEKLKKIYELLGEPCKNKKIIHIAGTNGKGSTVTFLEGIFFSAGYSVAKFTSPHILRFNERILVDKEMISDEDVVKYYEVVMDILEKNSLQINFFEITTFMALLYFEEKNPDFIFLETGLGGRYDATNVVNSAIAAITNVSFDHISLLGNSLEKIADRKAGIIKDGQLCIYAQNLAELENAVKKKTDNSVNVLKKYENLQVELDTQNYKTIIKILKSENLDESENIEDKKNKHNLEKIFKLPLFGKFQANNFLIAYEIAKIYSISDEVIQKGLDEISLAGRFEIFSQNPVTILDVAHNDDSVRVLVENLNELFKNDEVIFILSILGTKDIANIFEKILEKNCKIFITSLKDVTYGLSANEIKKNLENANILTNNIIFEDNILDAYNQVKEMVLEKNSRYKVIVVCGSFYEIAKFKKLFLK